MILVRLGTSEPAVPHLAAGELPAGGVEVVVAGVNHPPPSLASPRS